MFLSVITAPIVLAQLIDILIRQCNVNRIIILQIWSAMPIQDMNTSAPIYKKVKKIGSASPIRCDNACLKSCSKRKRKYWVLERNGTFKFKMIPNRHNAIQNLNYYLCPDPPLFSLPSTFKPRVFCVIKIIQRRYFWTFKEPSIPSAYVAWRAGMTILFLLFSSPYRLFSNYSTEQVHIIVVSLGISSHFRWLNLTCFKKLDFHFALRPKWTVKCPIPLIPPAGERPLQAGLGDVPHHQRADHLRSHRRSRIRIQGGRSPNKWIFIADYWYAHNFL